MAKYNRKDYMDKKVSHEEYYSQFVNDQVVALVSGQITVEAIKNSSDYPTFNDIPLRKWDDLSELLPANVISEIATSNASTTKDGIKTISLSDKVCVLKAAARIIFDKNK